MLQASPMDNTTNQYPEVDNYDIDNEIQTILVINHGQKVSNTNKKEHQQPRCRATGYASNDNKNTRHTKSEAGIIRTQNDSIMLRPDRLTY